MKPVKVLALLAVSALCLKHEGCLAQATFDFANWAITDTGLLDVPIFDSDRNPLSGTNYAAVLCGGPTPDSLTPAHYLANGQVVLPTPFTFVSPFGEVGYFNESLIVFIQNVEGNGNAWLQVKAWDTRLGGSYDAVKALGIGGFEESNIFLARGGNSGGVPTPPGFLIGLESFSLRPVIPEPAAWQLVLLGALAMWMARRRGK